MRQPRPRQGPGPWQAALFGLALATLPRRFRRRFGSEMRTSFAEGLEEAQERRGRRRFVWRSLAGVVKAGVAERLWPTMKEVNQREEGVGVRTVMGTLTGDVRLALRGMRRKPLFALVVVLTLGLGIGANSAIFSVVNGVLLTPLPYPGADRLISIQSEWSGPDAGLGNMSYPDLADIATEVVAIERLAGYGGGSLTLTDSGDPVRLPLILSRRIHAGRDAP